MSEFEETTESTVKPLIQGTPQFVEGKEEEPTLKCLYCEDGFPVFWKVKDHMDKVHNKMWPSRQEYDLQVLAEASTAKVEPEVVEVPPIWKSKEVEDKVRESIDFALGISTKGHLPYSNEKWPKWEGPPLNIPSLEPYLTRHSHGFEPTPDFAEGVKYDTDKPDFSLLPEDALLALAEHYTKGAKKYEARNWEKGMEYMRLYSAGRRHMVQWYMGKDTDEEGYSHLAAVVFCFLNLLAYELRGMGEKFDNRPDLG